MEGNHMLNVTSNNKICSMKDSVRNLQINSQKS